VNDKDISDDDLEEELDKALKASGTKRDVFSIIRKEKEALDIKEKRIKDKFKY
jgi:predicted Mrr-cat superfamily restriction endonuclease